VESTIHEKLEGGKEQTKRYFRPDTREKETVAIFSTGGIFFQDNIIVKLKQRERV